MAIEKRELGTQNDPDVIPMGSAMEVTPEPTRADQIRDAAEILVTEQDILVDDEIDAPVEMETGVPFDSNLAEFLVDSDLMRVAKDALSSIEADKESRADWEKTYVDGLKYLGMKFDDSRSSPFQLSLIHISEPTRPY